MFVGIFIKIFFFLNFEDVLKIIGVLEVINIGFKMIFLFDVKVVRNGNKKFLYIKKISVKF